MKKLYLITLVLAVSLGMTVNSAAAEQGQGYISQNSLIPSSSVGKQHKLIVIAQAASVMQDSDSDGVADAEDLCPTAHPDAIVGADGCELDGDKDGVVNRLDNCPETKPGVSVDANGCELDADGDGVFDSDDVCPDTPAGRRVDLVGCEIPLVIILKGVNFHTGSADLTDGSTQVLDGMVAILIKYPKMVVEVGGYTDNTGTKKINYSLSQRRAQAVLDYLVSQGANLDVLTAKGYGPEDPIADNDTEAGRTENRRVELHIEEKK